jgi:hypothetical protein
MTVRDRAANAYRENYNFYEEDYQGDPLQRSNFEEMAPMISKCVSGA